MSRKKKKARFTLRPQRKDWREINKIEKKPKLGAYGLARGDDVLAKYDGRYHLIPKTMLKDVIFSHYTLWRGDKPEAQRVKRMMRAKLGPRLVVVDMRRTRTVKTA